MFSAITSFLIASKSVGLMLTFVAIESVPAFPGATKSLAQNGDCSIFHAKACSLPPDPKSKMFISEV
jgi:hypothetical protein